MSHVHAFPCIRSFYSLYLDLFLLLGTFLIVSFSFSLFCLCESAFMAPKCKSTPSWNPLCSRASTSFDPTPFFVRFRDEKAKSNFFDNFSQRGIHFECQVILSDFFDTNLPTIIHSREWESLCDVSVTCPSVLIQEFYSNMHGFDSSVPLFVTRALLSHWILYPMCSVSLR